MPLMCPTATALEEVSLHLFTEENSWDFKDKQPPTPCLSGMKPVKMNGDLSPPH